MSIKYCFQNEIHKRYNFPSDFPSLTIEITSLFVQKLPTKFLLQYQDIDGDMITISNDQEYQALLQHELPLSSVLKLFIISLETAHFANKGDTNSDSNGSFEVVEADDNLKVQEITELSIPEEETKDNADSKVVVSLKIPQNSPRRIQCPSLKELHCEQEERSFTCSEPENSRVNESKASVKELSLSLEEEKSEKEQESPPEQQIKPSPEESLDYFESQVPQNTREMKSLQLDLERLNIADNSEVKSPQELDSKELNRYFSRTFNKEVVEQNIERVEPIIYCNTRNAVEENKYEEESNEKWVSFSSEQEIVPIPQNLELKGKSLFVTKQANEPWFNYNREREIPNRYRERCEDDERSECDEYSMQRARKKMKRSFEADIEVMRQQLGMLKDEEVEERKGRKRDFEQINRDSTEDYTVTHTKTRYDKNVWYDELYNVNIKDDFLQYLQQNNIHTNEIPKEKSDIPADSYLNRDEANKENIDKNIEENFPENVENMNLSLLTMSEAKYMASAIGSMHQVKGVEKLRIDNNFKENNYFDVPKQQTNQFLNKWPNTRDHIKQQQKEDLSFLKQNDVFEKSEPWHMKEKKAEPGSFCTRCWESPIVGPKSICLVCDVEYCSKCTSEISHIHPLFTIDDDSKDQELDLMNNIGSNLFPKNETLDAFKSDIDLREDFRYRDIDYLNRSFDRSFGLKPSYYDDEPADSYMFEYKELSTTPLLVKQNRKEWCVVYKTICLKNTGKCMWMRCHLEPIGVIAGTITEVTLVAPGDSALMTLEMHGFFSPGKYTSKWRVVHEGDAGILSEMGSIDLEFEVLESNKMLFTRQIEDEPEF